MGLRHFRLLLGLLFCLGVYPVVSAEVAAEEWAVSYELVAEDTGILPERSFWLALSARLEPGFQTYGKDAGDAGMPTSIDWELPPGFEVVGVSWPSPKRFDKDGMISYGYDQDFVLLAEVKPPKNLEAGQAYKLSACVHWVACDDGHCVPGDTSVEAKLPVVAVAPLKDDRAVPLFQQARKYISIEPSLIADNKLIAMVEKVSFGGSEYDMGLGLAIVLAFLGGMILNLMPCVLPVISLKVLSFVKIAGETRSTTLRHGVAFSAGVIASFWVLAGMLLALQTYGHAVGWGFQLQEPLFVAVLAAVLLVFGLSLFGVFEFGHMFASWAGQKDEKAKKESHGLTGSFLNGVLATAVATPCTGPFLGTAIGFAVTLSPAYSMMVFTSLGLGMAFPYLMLAAFPSLLRWLPKPGSWMVMFKQLMGFLILATILWLMWVFGAQTDNLGMFLLLSGLFVLSLACWVYGQWSHPVKSRRTRLAGGLSALLILLVGSYLVVISAQLVPQAQVQTSFNSEVKQWHNFSKETIDKLRAEGKPVFVDFTAKWCVICQTNFVVLNLADVANKFDELGVYRFKADWTRPDPVITEELRKFGRNGVPLYLLYRPGSDKPEILPQVLTPDTVLSYLKEMEEMASKDSGVGSR